MSSNLPELPDPLNLHNENRPDVSDPLNLFPEGHPAAAGLFEGQGDGGNTRELGLGDGKPDDSPGDERIESRTRDFAVRQQSMSRSARAAGVTRSDNQADLLGYVTPRRRSESRRMLG